MGVFKRGLLFKVSLSVLFIFLAVTGIFRDELPDVIANATLICYSCIGLK